MRSDDDRLFAGWQPTDAPAELGERVLAAARRGEPPLEPRRLEDRVWHSRGLRLAWAAATLALLAFNLWLPSPDTAPGRMHAETGVESPPGKGLQAPDAEDRPSWSDQRMLLCRVLDDCDRTIEGPENGGRI